MTINQWLDEFDLKNQVVNSTLKKLISNGDLRKEKSETDHRKTFIIPTDKGKKVIITGSNASLLSKELGSRLTGRNLGIELFPFSYKEFLNYYGYKLIQYHL